MNKEFIPYEQALELKELGLLTYKKDNDFGLLYKGSDIPSILYQQAFRWFREKYGLDYEITYAGKKGEYHAFVDEYIYGNNGSSPSIFSYEEAELECLKKLIIIVERKPEAYS
jgi:hypothetical protein